MGYECQSKNCMVPPALAGTEESMLEFPPSFPSPSDLTLTGDAQTAWHETAAAATRAQFGREIFVRAVVEVSNFCRENCAYCGMRRDNRNLHRFRAHHEQLAELLIHHRPASVTDVNIQAGEDPVAIREVVLPLIKTLQQSTSLGISVCLGTLTPELYRELRSAGASIYIMKFECALEPRYRQMHAPGRLEERLEHIRLLANSGWKVSSGFIAGLPGQETDELIAALDLARALPLDGCSVSPFIPGESTPLSGSARSNPDWTFNCMAALRLMRPHWVIPAVSALNLAEKNGYRRGLRAGANLTTINLTPDDMRGDYVIYKRDRFIMTENRVLDAIAAEGLSPSSRSLADHYRNSAPSVETAAVPN
jgi:biotin synthase